MEQAISKSLEFLVGGGEMGERIRQFDWAATSLGAPGNWEQSLKTCVRIMLSSKQPIWIGWGPQLLKFYNDAYIDIVRGKHPMALGQPASVVWKDIWRDIEPLLSKAMSLDEGTYVESQLLIMERSGFREETYYTFSYTPVLGENGRPAGIICYNTADTDRIIHERALRTMQQLDSLTQKKSENEVYAQTAFALAVNAKDYPFAIIYKIDPETQRAHIVGKSGIRSADFHNTSPVDLNDETMALAPLIKAVRENTIVESANPGRWKHLPRGAWDIAPIRFVDVPIRSGSQKMPRAVLTVALNPYRKFDESYQNFIQLISDQIALGVTNAMAYEEERKRAKALEELDKAKTLFFTNISHEFRTPLMLMLGPLEELLNKPQLALETGEKRHLEIAHRNAVRLLKLVNTLLDFSKIESGRDHTKFTLTDIAALTQNLASNFRSVIEKAGLAFVVTAGKIDAPVYVDRQMWEKILFNLLSNAFKYTFTGSISVDIATEGNNVLLTVADTGVGIPEHELPRMFERFHRVQNMGGRTFEGTGIGLSLVKELIELHHGKISVKSEAGKGSTFFVTIPTGTEHLNPAWLFRTDPDVEETFSNFFIAEAETLVAGETNSARNTSTQVTDSTETVLIVDDNADMRQHIQSLIGSRYKTLSAANGVEALQSIAEQKPELILSDIMMPEMDGIGLLQHVKANPETAQIPVILITARAGEESKIEGYETGADDYLVKPFSTNELLARVRSQLRMARTRRQFTEDLEKQVQERTGELLHANRELESFNYVASHDLQEPLRKIKTFIHLIDKNRDNPETVKRYFEKIHLSAERMGELIRSVLTYSRLAREGDNFSDVNLYELISEIRTDFELVMEEKQAVIECSNLPVLYADKLQLRQLFSNLISNSLKFSQRNPVINITCEILPATSFEKIPLPDQTRNYAHLTFSDNGIGFEQEFSEKIFSLFQRLHGRHEYAGTGIGLSIVKKVVENHQGYISASSQPGEGTTFRIWLPA